MVGPLTGTVRDRPASGGRCATAAPDAARTLAHRTGILMGLLARQAMRRTSPARRIGPAASYG